MRAPTKPTRDRLRFLGLNWGVWMTLVTAPRSSCGTIRVEARAFGGVGIPSPPGRTVGGRLSPGGGGGTFDPSELGTPGGGGGMDGPGPGRVFAWVGGCDAPTGGGAGNGLAGSVALAMSPPRSNTAVASLRSKTLVFSSSSSQSISTSLEFASGRAEGAGGAAPGDPSDGLAWGSPRPSALAGGGGRFGGPELLRGPGAGGGTDEARPGGPNGLPDPPGGGGSPEARAAGAGGGFGMPRSVL